MRKAVFAAFFLVLFVLCASSTALASPVILGFGSVPNGQFTSFSKAGYTVKNVGNDHWFGSTTGGNPGAGLVSGRHVGGTAAYNTASLTIGDGGNFFALDGFQIDNYGPTVNFTLTAFIGATQIFSISGSDPLSGWQTILTPYAVRNFYVTSYLLTVNISPLAFGPNAEFGLDNLIVSPRPTPEPSSLLLLGTGLAGLGMLLMRRRSLA